MDVNNILEYVWAGTMTIVAFLGKKKVDEVDELRKDLGNQKQDLADHRLHVSENYAKQSTIGDIYNCISEIRADVKTLIGRVGNK